MADAPQTPVLDPAAAAGDATSGTAADSGASTPSTPADAAKARREARKAKILNSGTDRLARITRSGRGADAEMLYPSSPTTATGAGSSSSSAAAAAAACTGGDAGSAAVRTSLPAGARSSFLDEEPLGGPLAGASRADDPFGLGPGAGFGAGGGPFGVGGGGGEGGFDFASVLARLQQHAAAQGGAAGEEGAAPGGGLPFDLNQLLAVAGLAGGGGAGLPPGAGPTGKPGAPQPPAAQPVAQGRSALDKSFDLIRTLIMIAFAFLSVSSLVSRPTTNLITGEKADIVSHDDHQAHLLQRWASLAYRKPAEWESQFFQMENFGFHTGTVPIFWLFVSVEVALQSTRILLFRNKPQPPSIFNTILNFVPLPPQLVQLIRTGASYIGLLSALLNDLAIVLFGVGLTIIWAQWKTSMTAESASTLGGAWDAAVQGDAGAASGQATSTLAAAASAVSETASAAFEAVTSTVNAGVGAAAQRAAEL
ncbi:hypothetical protein V8E36_005975 [Tilletia maclaganii]